MRDTPPELELSDVVDIKSLSKEELKLVPFESWKLVCKIEGCKRFTRVKDYGLWPVVCGRFQNSPWFNVYKQFLICYGHWKFYKVDPGKFKIKEGLHIDEIKKVIQ